MRKPCTCRNRHCTCTASRPQVAFKFSASPVVVNRQASHVTNSPVMASICKSRLLNSSGELLAHGHTHLKDVAASGVSRARMPAIALHASCSSVVPHGAAGSSHQRNPCAQLPAAVSSTSPRQEQVVAPSEFHLKSFDPIRSDLTEISLNPPSSEGHSCNFA